MTVPRSPEELTRLADLVRQDVLRIAALPEGTHLGSSLSCVDILVALHFAVLRNWDDREAAARDRFVLSKGHASAALYATLAAAGLLSRPELVTYGQPGSRLAGHPLRSVPGVEFATGSLGHGLPLGLGLAIAAQRDGTGARCFVLLGDGELQEGSNWEAAMAAAHYGADNLVAVVDRNGLQITGTTEDTIALEPLGERWRAFGWEVRELDGHHPAALVEGLDGPPEEPGRPVVVIARTVKGYGVPFLENRAKSHYVKLSPELLRRAQAALHARQAARR